MQTVPLRPLANQTLQVLLDNQACTIDLHQTPYGIFFDLSVNGTAIVRRVICQNRNRLVRSKYLGFSGDLVFTDTQGNLDPVYSGLGERYQLVWLSADEVAGLT